MSYVVYILTCKGNRLYTGITTDLVRRYTQHLNGDAANFTSAFPPIHIAAAWELNSSSRSDAQKLEAFIKRQSKKTKLKFIEDNSQLVAHIAKHQLIENLKTIKSVIITSPVR